MPQHDIAQYAADPSAFRAGLVIDAGSGAQPFRPDAWQAADFAALDGAWLRVAGRAVSLDCRRRAYLERPRGHSKTTDLAVMATWALAFSPRAIRGVCVAADEDQAGIMRDQVAKIVRLNGWLSEVLDVQRRRVLNVRTESDLTILASDVGSSYGLLVDFVLCDELVHWRNAELWESLLSTAAKKPDCLMVVISNAGVGQGTSWQWRVRESVRDDASWYFSRLDGPCASWISPSALAEQRRLLPDPAYRRLWLNEWTQEGDAIALHELDAAVAPSASPHVAALSGFSYVCGVDLGLTRDSSALCVLGRDVGELYENEIETPMPATMRAAVEAGLVPAPAPTYEQVYRAGSGKLHLAYSRVWRPVGGREISLQEIEDCIIDLHNRFSFEAVLCDQWNAAMLLQRLRNRSIPAVGQAFSAGVMAEMASEVLGGFKDHRFVLYNEPELLRDLRRAQVIDRVAGVRLSWPRDKDGHGDLGTGFSLAALAAGRYAAGVVESPEDSSPIVWNCESDYEAATN